MLMSDDHDPGDEDRRGSVACWCHPWCGLPICSCGEDHGGIDGRCRECDLDYMFERMTCTGCGKLRINDFGVQIMGADAKCTCPEPRPRCKS